MGMLTPRQIAEIERGDGVYYLAEERAMAPGSSEGWPAVIPAPHSKNGRLVRRVAGVGFDHGSTINPGGAS